MTGDIEQTAEHSTSELGIEFCGEWFHPTPGEPFSIGRDADLVIDTNPYLHRRLLEVAASQDLWWLANTGKSISVALATADGAYQAMLGPGTRVPLVFPELLVMFTAGSYTYEFTIRNDAARFTGRELPADDDTDGGTTIGAVPLTISQKQLLVALCEPILRGGMMGSSQIPSSAAAAQRLGWPLTTFNRKLDNVCDKFDREGVQGLRGGGGKLATNRRARLVEHAILSRVVTAADLPLLDEATADR
jgi:hypothetical protein